MAAVAKDGLNTAGSRTVFVLAACALGAALLAYSQTLAFAWDEGFHLLAAQLIKAGKRPYLDFVFAQTPLNAYWNAAWMRVFGESWRGIHAIDALLATAAVILAAGFVRSRFEAGGKRAWAAVLVLAGANIEVVRFGPIGQAYALSLLLMLIAFRLTVASAERDELIFAAFAGLAAGAAAGSTLLTAPAAPLLLLWMSVASLPGRRIVRGVVFVAGVLVSWTPMLALFAQSPARVLFDIFEYHMFYRRSDWPGATRHDLELFATWVESPQAILLVVLAAAGIWYASKYSGWERLRRMEFLLCGWLALGLSLYISTAHPTFVQYYLLPVPFLAIPASAGLHAVAERFAAKRPERLTAAVCALVALGTAKGIYDEREGLDWPRLDAVADKVNEVTPPGAPLYADEPTYFLAKRVPPPGNEYLSSHKLRLAADFSEFVHITPQSEFDRRIASGAYSTVETCEDETWIQQRRLEDLYRQKAGISDCMVFWDKKAAPKN